MAPHAPRSMPLALRRLLQSEATAGLTLMAGAVRGFLVAPWPLPPLCNHGLYATSGGLNGEDWIDHAFMAVFFPPIGLEIKRDMPRGGRVRASLNLLPARLLGGICLLVAPARDGQRMAGPGVA